MSLNFRRLAVLFVISCTPVFSAYANGPASMSAEEWNSTDCRYLSTTGEHGRIWDSTDLKTCLFNERAMILMGYFMRGKFNEEFKGVVDFRKSRIEPFVSCPFFVPANAHLSKTLQKYLKTFARTGYVDWGLTDEVALEISETVGIECPTN